MYKPWLTVIHTWARKASVWKAGVELLPIDKVHPGDEQAGTGTTDNA